MISPGTLCRTIRLTGAYAGANNRFVTTTGNYTGTGGAPCCEFEPAILIDPRALQGVVPFGFVPFQGWLHGVPEANLQPINDPPTCKLSDGQVRRRAPFPKFADGGRIGVTSK